MAIKIGSLFGDVSLRTANLDKSIASVGKKMRKLGADMTAMGKTLSAKVTAPLVGIGSAALVSFANFEKGMNEVRSLMPNLNQGEFKSMQQDVRELAVEMGVNAVESTKALYQAISAGIPKENAIEFLRTSSKAAIAGLTTTEKSVDALTSVLNAYKRSADEAEQVADVLFTTVRLGKTNFEELGSSIFSVAPLAAAMDIPLEEISAAVATLTKQGVPTAQAMRQIRGALVALQKPNADMVDALGKLGFSTGQSLLNLKGFQGGLEALRTQAGLTDNQLNRAFGSVEAFGAVLGLTGQNFRGAIEDLRAMSEASGAMTQAFETNNQGLLRSLEASLSIVREVGFQIAEQLAPRVMAVATAFKEWYKDNQASIPGWIELGVKLGAIAAALGPLLILMGQLVIIFSKASTWMISLGVGLGGLLHKLGFLKTAGQAVGEVVVDLFEKNWPDAIARTLYFLSELFYAFVPIDHAVDLLWRTVRPFFDFFTRQIAHVVSGLNMIYNAFKKIASVPGALGNALGQSISNIVYRADGGPVTAGSPYIVGEAGPELFVPHASGAIVPNHALAGQAGGTHITMNFAPGIGMDVITALKNNKHIIAQMALDAVRENNLRTL